LEELELFVSNRINYALGVRGFFEILSSERKSKGYMSYGVIKDGSVSASRSKQIENVWNILQQPDVRADGVN
jgi:hypothetical protein